VASAPTHAPSAFSLSSPAANTSPAPSAPPLAVLAPPVVAAPLVVADVAPIVAVRAIDVAQHPAIVPPNVVAMRDSDVRQVAEVENRLGHAPIPLEEKYPIDDEHDDALALAFKEMLDDKTLVGEEGYQIERGALFLEDFEAVHGPIAQLTVPQFQAILRQADLLHPPPLARRRRMRYALDSWVKELATRDMHNAWCKQQRDEATTHPKNIGPNFENDWEFHHGYNFYLPALQQISANLMVITNPVALNTSEEVISAAIAYANSTLENFARPIEEGGKAIDLRRYPAYHGEAAALYGARAVEKATHSRVLAGDRVVPDATFASTRAEWGTYHATYVARNENFKTRYAPKKSLWDRICVACHNGMVHLTQGAWGDVELYRDYPLRRPLPREVLDLEPTGLYSRGARALAKNMHQGAAAAGGDALARLNNAAKNHTSVVPAPSPFFLSRFPRR